MARNKREAQPLRRSARIASKSKLPPKPLSICEDCWKGPFAAQLGLFHTPLKIIGNDKLQHGGYTYFVSRSKITQRASTGCAWCNFVLRHVRSHPARRLKITVGLETMPPHMISPLVVFLNKNTKLFHLCLRTSAGVSANQHGASIV